MYKFFRYVSIGLLIVMLVLLVLVFYVFDNSQVLKILLLTTCGLVIATSIPYYFVNKSYMTSKKQTKDDVHTANKE